MGNGSVTNMKKIEFFHNVVCSHCFIMSRRLEEVLKAFPGVEVIHRSFPLHWDAATVDSGLSSHNQLLRKWEMANRIDEEKRFNVRKLSESDFTMPTSKNAHLAIRAAARLGEDPDQWFHLFQSALYEKVIDV